MPSKEIFYSWLTDGKKNNDKEYEHVFKVWNKFEMKTMKNYHNLYLKCDVLLLADLFGKFSNNSFKNYGLCLSHYLSTPPLSWDTMLNMTKVELELIPDSAIFIFFEKGIRVGVYYNFNRYIYIYQSQQEVFKIL